MSGHRTTSGNPPGIRPLEMCPLSTGGVCIKLLTLTASDQLCGLRPQQRSTEEQSSCLMDLCALVIAGAVERVRPKTRTCRGSNMELLQEQKTSSLAPACATEQSNVRPNASLSDQFNGAPLLKEPTTVILAISP